MRSFQRIAELTHTTIDLIAQLRELEELREQVRTAEMLRRASPSPRRAGRRNRTRSHGRGRIVRSVLPP